MRATRRLMLLAGIGSILACGSPSPESGDPVADVSPTDPLGLVSLPSCGVGTMALIGKSACVSVGPTSVPEGFAPAEDDWGFHAVIPWNAECGDGGKRGKLGSSKCVPIDDCTAPFPPAGAVLVTNDVELRQALAGTAATIALDDNYYKPFEIRRDVTIVGRCAPSVEVSGQIDGVQGTLPGIEISGPHKVTIRGVTLHRNHWGIQALDHADVTVEKAYFKFNDAAGNPDDATLRVSGSLIGAGIDMMFSDGFIVSGGGHLEVDDSEFRGMHVAIDAYGLGSTAKGSGLIMTEQSNETSALVVSSDGADVTIDRSLVMAQEKWLAGARTNDPRLPKESNPARLRVENSELIRVLPTISSGVSADDGSTVELVNDTVLTRARIAIQANNGGVLSVAQTVIRPVLKTDVARRAVGQGIVLYDDSRLTFENSAVIAVAQTAILASKGTHTEMRGSLVADVWENERKGFDKRIESGQAISLNGDASIEITDSTFQDNAGASIWMGREGATLTMTRGSVIDTRPAGQSTAVAGLVGWGGTVQIEDSLFHGIPDTALAFGDAIGAVANTVLSQTPVGFRWMGASRLVESSDPARRAEFGEVLSRNVVQIETTAPELEEALPLGDCTCAASKR